MKKSILGSAVIAALCTTNVNAVELATGPYIAPSISYQNFGGNVLDDDFNLESDTGFGIGLGYQFDSPWALELVYNAVETEPENGNADVDSEYIHLDAIYHTNIDNPYNWVPYWVAGIGSQAYEADNYDENDIQLNAGAGIKYAFNSNFFVRTDARVTLGAEDVDMGTQVNLGLVYIFGKAKASNKATVAAPVESAPAKPKAVEAQPAQPAVIEESTPVVVAPVDSDNDGVIDANDQCPDTKAGAKVDEKGCYQVLKETKAFTLNVKFKTSSSVIEPASKDEVKGLAEFLTSYPQTQVVIEGHSDSRGAAAFNKRLSQQRADSVKASLVNDFGIDASRITAKGYGEEQPIADNATAEGRAKNRRVVAKVKTTIEKIVQ